MIGYLGPKGTFSHQAALEWTKDTKEALKEYSTIYNAIMAVNQGEIERAIIPIENSIEGSINMTLDTLAFETDLFITGEYVLSISQNLMVKKGFSKADIQLITSHPQPIGQCSHMLSQEFSEIKIEFADSTASAAKRVAASDGSIACIASPNSAKLYDLTIITPNCGDDKNNSTRFVIVEKQAKYSVSGRAKTSIAFTLSNQPGSLYHALELFAQANINLLKIESRPVKTHLGEYVFFVDMEGCFDDAVIYFALDKVRRNTSFFKFLGTYPY